MGSIVRKESCINGQDHMTKLATMAINRKYLKIFFSRTRRPMAFETWHEASENGALQYKVCINHDPGMTLTYFTARSIYVGPSCDGDKLLEFHLNGKTCSNLTNGLNIYDFEKEIAPMDYSDSILVLYTCIKLYYISDLR